MSEIAKRGPRNRHPWRKWKPKDGSRSIDCPDCKRPMLRSLQARKVKQPDGTQKKMMRPYPDGYLTCPCCPIVINTNNGDVYRNNKLEGSKKDV